jgi:hypothetical protein
MKSTHASITRILLGAMFGLLTFAFVGTASGDTVDGFDITFDLFPTQVLSGGLTPDSLILNGDLPGSFTVPAENVPIHPYLGNVGGIFDEAWEEGTATGNPNHNPWGATNPFVNTALDGGEYDALYDGVATYNYGAPQSDLTILWGTPASPDGLEFFAQDGVTQIGQAIDGQSLIEAAEADIQGYSTTNANDSIYVTIHVPSNFYSVKTIGRGLTFEYSNLVAKPTPEPSTYAMMLGTLALLGYCVRRKAAQTGSSASA